MRLGELLAVEDIVAVHGDTECEVTGLAYDSRQVAPGFVFFAVHGEKFDGHDFLQQAVARGAKALVVSRAVPVTAGAVLVRVRNVRRTMGLWSAHFYGEPSRRLKLVGITGTNGKTTCCYLVESILMEAGLAPGVIGTINYRHGARRLPSHHTTPESLDLQSMLAEMLRDGAGAVAMEVSSHALVQERARGLHFDAALFTNLSRDHLDYHASMDDYFAAKSKLFTDHLAGSAKAKRSAVIYGGDPRAAGLVELLRDSGVAIWTYGEDSRCDVHPLEIASDVAGTRGRMAVKERPVDFSSALIGPANLQNLLGAAAVGAALELPCDVIAWGIQRLARVPGRLEKVDNARGIAVLVDYAHTPDALEKVLGAVRVVARGRVFAVFGCGGDRDRGKRPLMGEIAARLSDIAVATSDNPRTEEPGSIIAEIEEGLRRAGKPKLSTVQPETRSSKRETQSPKLETDNGYYVEVDRRAAIRIALASARPGDVILIAGKGHEDYQIIGKEKIHFDDREVAREEMARL
jgi:UDP-N-acetylmuramoyl-L-alanyl-D-glutamate--2,6-diaminopimelate ligase